MSEHTYEVVPIEGQDFEGDQYGWRVLQDGRPLFDCTTGGTGPCWNVLSSDDVGDSSVTPLHICEIDEVIEALEALRDSQAHKDQVERWGC